MSDNSANNKRIAINTILLYIRMMVTMVVGLFTSRVVLQSLGVEDYGIYNLVGGFVSMFSIVNAGLVASTQRFLTFDLGKGDVKELNRTFTTIVLIYASLCVLVIIVSELGGIWFIGTKLTIPADRMYAAEWVFQLSLVSLLLSLLSSPYNALIIAHERMKAFAYVTIYEVIMKLIVAYAILICSFDKLIVYAVLICLVHVTIPLLYSYYCHKNFAEEVHPRFVLEWTKIKEIYSFAGWTMLGSFAHLGFTQGLNMLLGLFFNPAVNAARGIAVQVQSIVLRFVQNFQTAIDPQIIKSYARNNISYMFKLISTSARFSYFLMLFISMPVILEAEMLLDLWLVDVPDYTPIFFRLIIFASMYDAITNPFAKAVHSTGKIKWYSIMGSGILLLIVPVAYIVLRCGGAPYSVFVVHVVIGFVALVQRVFMARKALDFSMSLLWIELFRPLIITTCVGLLIPLSLKLSLEDNYYSMLIVCGTCVISVGLSIFLFGISKTERNMLTQKIKSYGKNKVS